MTSLIIILIVVPFFLGLLGKLFKSEVVPPNLDTYTPEQLQQIQNKFKLYSILSFVIGFLLVGILTYLLTKGMVIIQSDYLKTNDPDVVYTLPSTSASFTVPGLFLSILVGGILNFYMFSMLGRKLAKDEQEWQIYLFDSYKKSGFGNPVNLKLITIIGVILIVPISLITLYLALDDYARITKNNIVWNGYFQFSEKKYTYHDIKKVLLIKSFKNAQNKEVEEVDNPYYTVVMGDGFNFDTLNYAINRTPKEVEVINFISTKANTPIQVGVHNIDDN